MCAFFNSKLFKVILLFFFSIKEVNKGKNKKINIYWNLLKILSTKKKPIKNTCFLKELFLWAIFIKYNKLKKIKIADKSSVLKCPIEIITG